MWERDWKTVLIVKGAKHWQQQYLQQSTGSFILITQKKNPIYFMCAIACVALMKYYCTEFPGSRLQREYAYVPVACHNVVDFTSEHSDPSTQARTRGPFLYLLKL